MRSVARWTAAAAIVAAIGFASWQNGSREDAVPAPVRTRPAVPRTSIAPAGPPTTDPRPPAREVLVGIARGEVRGPRGERVSDAWVLLLGSDGPEGDAIA